jgi:anhydro-N-acetylmuramic acid kinase
MMSGTSADGIDVALVRIESRSASDGAIDAQFERHFQAEFPSAVRKAILRLANGTPTTTAEISHLNFLLGEEFARAAIAACGRWRVPLREVALIGSHGQTIYHQGEATEFLTERKLASTLQIADAAVIAERTGIPTIADFRTADMAAGGHGAPLVPFVDYLLYRHRTRGRIALNIGGIANFSVIPAGAKPEDVRAFDTGPGNMVIDALVEHYSHGRLRFDRDAKLALRGRTIPALLDSLLADSYFAKKPPKTAGREQFGAGYAAKIAAWGKRHRARPEDIVRTATMLTPLSIVDAIHRFVVPHTRVDDLIVAGGGSQNPLIMLQLGALLPGITILEPLEFGVPAHAKEAFAFAVLAYEAWRGRTNNLPSATGAHHPAILGKLSLPSPAARKRRGGLR